MAADSKDARKKRKPSRSIPGREIGILWGRAAGQCSFCGAPLAPILEQSGPIVLGEMCHIIAYSPGGPRGSENVAPARRNLYDNLILLCPTHHTEVDRAPADYSVERLQERKRQHEAFVSERLAGERFSSIGALMRAVLARLNENYVVWEAVGPESAAARANPLTNAADWWHIRKITRIIPNNAQVLAWLDASRTLLTPDEATICAQFREHALALERSTFAPLDLAAQPRFPAAFRNMAEQLATKA